MPTRLIVISLCVLVMSSQLWAQRARGRRPREEPPIPQTQPEPEKPAAQNKDNDKDKDKQSADNLVVTDHQITVHGDVLKYKATAGTIVVKDEQDKPKAKMFFVAYEKQPAAEDRSQRPITFVFNGGPGAAAVWLHLGTAGPRRIALNDAGTAPSPPYHLVDNENTWLVSTDLVFIDPVGTGYSRPAAGEKPEQFFGVEEDVHSVGEFIRLYTTRYDRWLSPKFLAGESYGTTRAAALSDYLLENGISLNGIVLISSVLNFQTISFGNGNDLPYALYLPSYTALAWYHKKLDASHQADLNKALDESEQWALTGYLSDLAAGSQLPPDQRESAIRKLASLTGLSPQYVDRANLRIEPGEFRKQLLADEHKVLGRFDARLTGFDTDRTARSPDYDPSFAPFLDGYTAAFTDYVRRTLKYDTDLTYEALSKHVRPWNMSNGGSGYLDVLDRLRASLVQTPNLRVMFCQGRFDLATPYLAMKYTVNHLDVAPEIQKNVTESFFDSGHMVYHHAPDRLKLGQNIADFIRQATANSEDGGAASSE